jgi:hypothetical protein
MAHGPHDASLERQLNKLRIELLLDGLPPAHRIFQCYQSSKLIVFTANLKKGKARKVLITRLVVAADRVWQHVVSPKLRTRVYTSPSDPVVHASMTT